jgi:hypothetical protein
MSCTTIQLEILHVSPGIPLHGRNQRGRCPTLTSMFLDISTACTDALVTVPSQGRALLDVQ